MPGSSTCSSGGRDELIDRRDQADGVPANGVGCGVEIVRVRRAGRDGKSEPDERPEREMPDERL